MSSIFQDTTNIYSDGKWESSPWRNYHRDIGPAIARTFSVDDVDYELFCAEEDLVGLKIGIDVTDSSTDRISKIRLYDGATTLATSQDVLTLGAGLNVPAWRTDSSYSWFMPGIGFRFSQTVESTSTFTANRYDEYTILESDLGEKRFDGGIHSWIKLDTVAVGILNNFNSKVIPSEFLRGKNNLLVFNSLSNKHSYGIGGNVAITMHLMGSVDGINFDTLGEIFSDTNLTDTSATGMSATYQITHLLSGLNYQKYPYYKFRWYVEDGSGTERMPLKQNFVKLSLYKL